MPLLTTTQITMILISGTLMSLGGSWYAYERGLKANPHKSKGAVRNSIDHHAYSLFPGLIFSWFSNGIIKGNLTSFLWILGCVSTFIVLKGFFFWTLIRRRPL